MNFLRAGDSGARNMLRLAQALECLGKPEDALGATYFASKTDTTGWTDLTLYRVYLLRSLGLEAEAQKLEMELGTETSSTESQWMFENRPQFSASIGWVRQVVQPIGASLYAQYQQWNDRPTGQGLALRSLGRYDSVFVEGVQVPVSANLDWGGFSTRSSVVASLSWWVGLASSLDQWRSQSLSATLQWDRELVEGISISANGGYSRSWIPVDGVPTPMESDLTGGLNGSVKTFLGGWSLSNSVHAVTFDEAWTWSGDHGLGWDRTWFGGFTPSIKGSFSWSKDPNPNDIAGLPVKILQAQGIREGVAATQLVLLDTAGNPVGEWSQIKKIAHPDSSVSRFSEAAYPLSINQDWVRANGSISLTAKPWKSLVGKCGGSWSRTFYLEPQSKTNLEYDAIYMDGGYWVLFQDPATRELFATKSNSLTGLVPYSWTRKRRDDTWSIWASLSWTARKWLSFQGSWTSSRTESNVEDWLDGATSNKEIVSLRTSLSW